MKTRKKEVDMVSVVIPVYNSEKYIYQAVRSALIQDVPMQIVVVDDATGDNSIPVLLEKLIGDEYIAECSEEKKISEEKLNELDVSLMENLDVYKNDNRIAGLLIVRNNKNRGVAETRNIGVRLSSGEYIALLDSDDYWGEGKLKAQLKKLAETGAVLCNTGREFITAEGEPTGHVVNTPEKITLKMLEKTNYINCSSVLVRRDVMLRYPMERSDLHEDYLTWLKLLGEYDFVVGIDEPYLKYRLSESGKSRNKLKSAVMQYRTYVCAGYGRLRSAWMMIAYTINGIRKYM